MKEYPMILDEFEKKFNTDEACRDYLFQTAWTWLHKIRRAMVRPDRDKLSGFVEVDDAYIGGKEKDNKCGRGTENKVLAAIAVEIKEGKIGRIRIGAVDDASSKCLHKFVQQSVKKIRFAHGF